MVAAIFLLPVSYGRPPLALAGFLVITEFAIRSQAQKLCQLVTIDLVKLFFLLDVSYIVCGELKFLILSLPAKMA